MQVYNQVAVQHSTMPKEWTVLRQMLVTQQKTANICGWLARVVCCAIGQLSTFALMAQHMLSYVDLILCAMKPDSQS